METTLKSSAIRRIEYSPMEQILLVEFTDGTEYEYEGVTADLVAGLLTAESAGRYFNRWIRPLGS